MLGVSIIIAGLLLLSLFVYRQITNNKNFKEFCNENHLKEIAETIGILKKELDVETVDTEMNAEDVSYKTTSQGLIITYSSVQTKDGYHLHHISMSRIGSILSLKSLTSLYG